MEVKRKLELDIASSVSNLIEMFINATGQYPCSVSVFMASTQAMGDDKPKYVVADVSVDLSEEV